MQASRSPAIRAIDRLSAMAWARATVFAAALLLAGCGGDGGSSDNGPPPPPPPLPDPQVRITGLSPFAPGCDGVLPTGTLYVNTEVEPHVAVNPSNPSHLVAAWQQDRWSDGAARGLRSAVSTDGGRTWTASSATFSRCTGGTPANGGDYTRASDPWAAIGPEGTAYQIAISVTGTAQTLGSLSAVLAARSPDGGRTWEPPVTLIRDEGLPFNDKESITADRYTAGFAYAVWDRLDGDRGPMMFARTTDAGRTWEPARAIHDPGPGRQTLNAQVVVLPDGTLVAFFSRFVYVGPTLVANALVVMRSPDKGATWSAPVTIGAVQARGATDPESGTLIRDGANLGSIAAGRNGQLAVAWQDSRFSGGQRDGIAFSRSFDGGLTWTTPVQINRVPSVQAFLPTVHIRDDGTIGVTHFDLRNNTSAASLLADYWLLQSSDGVTWRETRVASTFDYGTAPFARGLFLGDYMGLTSMGETFVPVSALANSGNATDRTDVVASLVSSAGAAAKDEGVTFEAGPPTEALPLTPELDAALAASVRRTLERRREPGPGVAPPTR
jgi:hypothetical protein